MAQTDRTNGLVGNSGFKAPCRAASTAALTLSGEQTVDNVALVTGDRVLVKDQASSVDNGIYVVDTGSWSRALDADGHYDWLQGSLVFVYTGTSNGNKIFKCTTSGAIEVGTDALAFSSVAMELLGVARAIWCGTATGTANALVLTPTTAVAASELTAGLQLVFKSSASFNTGATTIAVSGNAAIAVQNNGAACTGHEIEANKWYRATLDGAGVFQLERLAPAMLLTGDDTASGTKTFTGNVNVGGNVSLTSGQTVTSGGVTFTGGIHPGSTMGYVGMINGTIVQTRAGGVETIAIKTLAGTDPSATDPVSVIFRDPSPLTGGYVQRRITSALSLAISSGSTMGVSAINTAFNLWYVLFDDGGTVRLSAINCLSGLNIYPLGQFPVASSTAEGGAGAADSAHVFYTGTAVVSRSYVVVGYATWASGLAVLGTWDTAPSRIELYGAGIPLPGDVLQTVISRDASVATGTGTIPADDTIPQNTEGTQFMSQAIAPTSAANLLDIYHQGNYSNNNASQALSCALFQDSVANALCATSSDGATWTDLMLELVIAHRMLAGTTASTTFKIRAGNSVASTTTFNGIGGTRRFGGVCTSDLRIEEVMT